MAVMINLVDTTAIDETTGLQQDDIGLTDFKTNHASAAAALDAALLGDTLTVDDAIQIAGDSSADLTLSPLTDTVDALGFVALDSNGENPTAVDGLDSGRMTLDGNEIFLYADPNNDNVIIGREGSGTTADPDGAPVLAVYLEEQTNTSGQITGATYWMVLLEPLFHPDGTNPDDMVTLPDTLGVAATGEQNFSFANAPAGNNTFMAFGTTASAILVTGVTADQTVNSSHGGGLTTLGTEEQDLRAGQVMAFTYVTGMNPDYLVPDLTHKEATTIADIDYTSLQDANQTSFELVKLTGGTSVDVKVTAIDEDQAETGANYFPGLTDGDESAVTIDHVYVNGTEVAIDGTHAAYSGDGVVVYDVPDDSEITIHSSDNHNRLLIANAEPTGSNVHFSIGGFSINNAITAFTPVGDQLEYYDDGPSAAIAADGTEPGTAYLFDGNQANGNFEGNNGTGLPTGDVARDGTPTSVDVEFGAVFSMTTSGGADGDAVATAWSLVLAVAAGTQVQFSGAGATSGGVDVVWQEVTAGSEYAGVINPGTADEAEIFSLSVDGDGTVTFSQSGVLDHARTDSTAPYTTDILTLSDNQISVQKSVTVTDNDTDTATQSASVDLGGNFAIGDDGPKVTVAADGTEPGTAYLFDGNQASGNFEGNNGTGLPTGDVARDGTPTSVDVEFGAAFSTTTSAGADGGSVATNWSLVLAVAAGTQVQFSGAGATSGGVDVVWQEVTAGSEYAGVINPGTVDEAEIFSLSVDGDGTVTFSQSGVLDHPRTDSTAPYTTDILTLSDNQISVQKSVTVTDNDTDTATQSASVDLGGNFAIGDDGPKVTVAADGTEPGTAYLFDGNQASGNFEGNNGTGLPTGDVARDGTPTSVDVEFGAAFSTTTSAGADGGSAATNWSLVLAVAAGTQVQFSGAGATSGGVDVVWQEVTAGSEYAGVINPGTVDEAEIFSLSVDSDGTVTFSQSGVLDHARTDSAAPYTTDILTLSDNQISVQKSVTVTDNDTDTATQSASVDLGGNFAVGDDGPAITVAPVALTLDNTAATITGTEDFGYNIGADARTDYATSSDFVDTNGALAGLQIGLSGTVGSGAITNTDVTLTSESATSASFDFTFDYDFDPLTSGLQSATATGTLTFDKVNDTYAVSLDNPIEGFSFQVLRTSELLAKNPTSNTGHPDIVVEKLASNFFVQFTADASDNRTALSFSPDGEGSATGDTDFTGSNHDLVGRPETWVSATQDTNGVAGDTIQKDEVVTLRFFKDDILSDVDTGTEKTDPTATADGIVLKFDGIGSSEDLIVILDLIDPDTKQEITKALIVDNADIIKTGGVPAPYSSEFTLDNNDGLLVIESNDYNLSATEHWNIQGLQIMQSGNNLTGTGINLNGATGENGGSSGTQAFEATDNDVLKIVDIGFVTSDTGAQDADLDFAFRIADFEGDTTAEQHLDVHVEADGIIA